MLARLLRLFGCIYVKQSVEDQKRGEWMLGNQWLEVGDGLWISQRERGDGVEYFWVLLRLGRFV